MKKKVLIKCTLQKGHYFLTAPVGRKFDPEFKPELTPKEMLALGVFGGAYFAKDKIMEFPKSWFTRAKKSETGNKDPELNFFKVEASMSLAHWKKKGWIHPQDPRGWFQWYCRYYYGRRTPEEDARQIKRWKAFKRHISQIKKNCKKGDHDCRRKQRQAGLHWAYDTRKM